MVKRAKTPKRKKVTPLAELARRRPPEEAPEPNYPEEDEYDPSVYPGRTIEPLPKGWRPRIPGELPPQLRVRLHRVGGAPLQDPLDKREARYALRLHQDLMAEVAAMARARGWKVSQLIEKTLIDLVNSDRKTPIVDQIGRYIRPDDKR